MKKTFVAMPLMLCLVPVSLARDPKVTKDSFIWRVTETSSGMVYYAQSFEAGWLAMGGGLFSANGNGTVVYAPTQGSDPCRIASGDSWHVGSAPTGATASWKGTQSGFAAITAEGVQNPAPPAGKGYLSAKFRDLQTKKTATVSIFTAEKVKAGEIPGLLDRKK